MEKVAGCPSEEHEEEERASLAEFAITQKREPPIPKLRKGLVVQDTKRRFWIIREPALF
jgi:hypothetical protein